MSLKNSLIKDLQRIAARKLRNTRGVPENLKGKFELIDLAFGHAEVLEDFEKWCDENADRNPQYPVTEYIRRIDSRLGTAPTIDAVDPRVEELRGLTYSLTEVVPHLSGVRNLLAIHTVEEIKEALLEYLSHRERRKDGCCGSEFL